MSQVPSSSSVDELIAVLRRSHDRVAAALEPLTDAQLTGPAYPAEWSIAQVASHLGSGAEVFALFLEAGLQQTDAPGLELIQPIWDRWNAKLAPEQAHDFLIADAALFGGIDALDNEERERWRLDLFGTEQNLAGLLRMRLAEHAVHTWDIAVALDPKAAVADDAVGPVIDTLPTLVEHVGQPVADPVTVDVRTSGPDRHLRLELTADGALLAVDSPDNAGATAALRLPAGTFVRLVYGRLDPDHTPESVDVEGVELDTLRRAFPGL